MNVFPSGIDEHNEAPVPHRFFFENRLDLLTVAKLLQIRRRASGPATAGPLWLSRVDRQLPVRLDLAPGDGHTLI